MNELARASDIANLGLSLSIVAITLAAAVARRGDAIVSRSWWFFTAAAVSMLAHSISVVAGGPFAQWIAATDTLTIALLGYGLVLLYGADADRVHALERDSQEDPLTGLMNMRAFTTGALQRLALADKHGGKTTLVLLDLDLFKRVNDVRGHQAGDLVLQSVAAAVRANVRSRDLAARYGGDEFILLLDRADELEARRTVARLRNTVEALSAAAGSRVSLSAGLAVHPDAGRGLPELIALADQRLLAAKHERAQLDGPQVATS